MLKGMQHHVGSSSAKLGPDTSDPGPSYVMSSEDVGSACARKQAIARMSLVGMGQGALHRFGFREPNCLNFVLRGSRGSYHFHASSSFRYFAATDQLDLYALHTAVGRSRVVQKALAT